MWLFFCCDFKSLHTPILRERSLRASKSAFIIKYCSSHISFLASEKTHILPYILLPPPQSLWWYADHKHQQFPTALWAGLRFSVFPITSCPDQKNTEVLIFRVIQCFLLSPWLCAPTQEHTFSPFSRLQIPSPFGAVFQILRLCWLFLLSSKLIYRYHWHFFLVVVFYIF